ncbi:hypothetical protein [Kosakonia cowanii]|uniref:hypothetical protein n=1 Tax=Kosakonia cowanii TaxID=208223 RepID=UPI00289BAC70|nr:hypothetical protein [Kosakonia cowanii]
MQKQTGGTAFPLPLGSETVEGCAGMTLRDYFAAKAMQSTLSDPACLGWDAAYHAKNAYKVADAMLRTREAS